MLGVLVVNHFLNNGKFGELHKMFLNSAKKLDIDLRIHTNLEYNRSFWGKKQDIHEPDFVLFWDKDLLLAKSLENMRIPVYNCSESIMNCDDKGRTFICLRDKHIKTPKTIVAPMTYDNIGYNDIVSIGKMVRESGITYPLIVKESQGSFGEQVYLINDEMSLEKKIAEISPKPFVVQEFIANSLGRDIRLQVVGDRVVASMLRISENDFRANITAGGKMQAYDPDEEARKLAVAACKATGCLFAGVDLLFAEEGYTVCEVNSNAHFKNLYDCTGVDVSLLILEEILRRIGK